MQMTEEKYKVSDFIYDSMKSLRLYLLFNAAGYVAYAFTVGHIMLDEQVSVEAKNRYLCFYSAAMLAAFLAVLCSLAKNNIARKTALIKASRADDFDAKAYYKNTVIRNILPLFCAGIVILLPFAIFYMRCGYGYENSLGIERLFAANMLFMIPLGGILGVIVQNILFSGAYSLYLYKLQCRELADRMWLKDAPKQEKVELKPLKKDNYKNY